MNSIKNTIKLFSLTIGVILFSSCERFLDINENPTTISSPDPNFTLSFAQVNAANHFAGSYQNACGYWIQYYTQAGNVAGVSSLDQYQLLSGNNAYQNRFNGLYSGALVDLKYTYDKGIEVGNNNVAAIAEMLSAFTFQMLVDLYDQVPYSEALNPLISAPAYDDGDAIYADLITRVEAAIDLIDNTQVAPVSGDIIYGGDMALWEAFGNTLLLKLYMRQSEVSPSTASAGIGALTGPFLRIGEDAELPYDHDNTNNRHPAGISDVNIQSFNAISSTLGDYMVNNGDPRLDVFFRRPVDPDPVNAHQFVDQAGGPGLVGTTGGLSYYTAKGAFLVAEGSAFPYISAAESYFLQAEAIARGWMTGDAEAMYDMGVTASFENGGLSSGDATSYLGGVPYPNGTEAQNVEAIMMEKWVALQRQSVEMYAEWRRTGYPGTSIIATSPISLLGPGEFPIRFPWIQREFDINENTPDLEELTVPVWWDQ